MCLSRIGQIAYGGFALISIGLILGSLFTPAWRQVYNNIQQGQIGQLPPLNMGLFSFACQRSNVNTQYPYNGNVQTNTFNQGINNVNNQGNGYLNNNNYAGQQTSIQQGNSASTAITVSTQSGTQYLDLCIAWWNVSTNKGPCYDITTNNYLSNAITCQNEAETVDDPELSPEKLCSTTQTGRFNLIGLIDKNTGNAVVDINKERNENCEIQDQIIFSSRCRKSCKTCCLLPEYGSCKDSINNCQITQCNDLTYSLNQCPSTCGKCKEIIRQNKDLEYCADIQTNCATLKEQQKCLDLNIQKECALTCNDWPDNNICKKFTQEMRNKLNINSNGQQINGIGNIGTNCQENKELCNDSFYKEFMQKYCKSTCINSITDQTPEECEDKKHTNCVIWKINGFCTNDFFPNSMREEYCKKSCHLC
ncbi:hypothetical protein Mgra_00005308 [Meloidogyne graminicola]|uniref:ShKT domain-containing protein n=1 Tax=Meloidogyne graminicola TaxID=189291 RepID=A0A8S9ZP29_9BILA|nr:hypothetical protein Mgra_00005308 [Meloidogyne graminicola]